MILSNKAKLMRAGRALGLVSVLACSALAAATAQAMGPMGGGRPQAMMGGHMEHMLEMVDASDAQRGQIKQIMDAARQDLKSQRAGAQQLHEQRMSLLAAPNIDTAAVEALRQQMSAQHEQASKRMSQAMVDAARVLTPEQRQKMAARMKKMQARKSEHQHRAPDQAN